LKDVDKKFFEEMLLDRKKQIQKNISETELEKVSMAANDLNDEADFASADIDNIIDDAIISQQGKELLEIEQALEKIKSGDYGTCEMCEESIGFSRLKVKPFAKYCITCRTIVEKSEKNRKQKR
jgi:DnaK suppressor protein